MATVSVVAALLVVTLVAYVHAEIVENVRQKRVSSTRTCYAEEACRLIMLRLDGTDAGNSREEKCQCANGTCPTTWQPDSNYAHFATIDRGDGPNTKLVMLFCQPVLSALLQICDNRSPILGYTSVTLFNTPLMNDYQLYMLHCVCNWNRPMSLVQTTVGRDGLRYSYFTCTEDLRYCNWGEKCRVGIPWWSMINYCRCRPGETCKRYSDQGGQSKSRNWKCY